MSRSRSFNRFHRFLAKQHRRVLKKFRDTETPKDVLLIRFKQDKEQLQGT
jgi:hypothetical protein